MLVDEFINHLYKNIWIFIINERSFQEYRRTDVDNDYDLADFYSDNIPELFKNLERDYNCEEIYKQIVSVIGKPIRQNIVKFMAWFSVMKNKNGSDIFNEIHNHRFNLDPLTELIKLVENTDMPQTTDYSVVRDKMDIVFTVIEKFTSATKSLVNRRKNLVPMTIDSEYAVQDILQAILKPFIPTIKSEEVVSGNDDGRFLKIDFLIKSEKAAIECKYIRDEEHAKKITKELNDDIQTYINHQDCNKLIFFVYDKNTLIENPDVLEENYSKKQSIEGKEIQIFLKIRPKN